MTNVYDEASIVDTLAAGIAELQASLTKRDYADKCRLEAYAERNETIAQLRADHNACADEALIADTTIAERDATITVLRTDQKVYEALVARHEQTISERDATIVKLRDNVMSAAEEMKRAILTDESGEIRVRLEGEKGWPEATS